MRVPWWYGNLLHICTNLRWTCSRLTLELTISGQPRKTKYKRITTKVWLLWFSMIVKSGKGQLENCKNLSHVTESNTDLYWHLRGVVSRWPWPDEFSWREVFFYSYSVWSEFVWQWIQPNNTTHFPLEQTLYQGSTLSWVFIQYSRRSTRSSYMLTLRIVKKVTV